MMAEREISITTDGVQRRSQIVAAIAILAVSLVISFVLYMETLTPPSRPIDLLVHVVFFPLVYPLAPLFLDSAFGLGAVAYATYPGIALALILIVGSRAPVGLAATALLTSFFLPWTLEPLATMGYQSGPLAASVLGLGPIGQVFAVAVPFLCIAALIAPKRPAGILCLFFGTMICAVLVVGAIGNSGFGSTAVGGYITIASIVAAAIIALTQLSGHRTG